MVMIGNPDGAGNERILLSALQGQYSYRVHFLIDSGAKTGALMNKTGALLMNKNVYVREILGVDLIGGDKDPLQVQHTRVRFLRP